MIVQPEWILLDTNIWIFGLRHQPDRLQCGDILKKLGQLYIKLPRQILLELRSNLNQREMRDLFLILNRFPHHIEVSWSKAQPSLIRKYERLGCKRGDAVIAAHADALKATLIVTENREFLARVAGLPFRVLNSKKFLAESLRSQ